MSYSLWGQEYAFDWNESLLYIKFNLTVIVQKFKRYWADLTSVPLACVSDNPWQSFKLISASAPTSSTAKQQRKYFLTFVFWDTKGLILK